MTERSRNKISQSEKYPLGQKRPGGLGFNEKWGPQKNENPLPVYCILPLESNNSKENRRHNVHKHLAAVLCIIPNQNGGIRGRAPASAGEPLGIP
nr:MAG TPA: hypothetical protein [Caudoviricetes sp.]